MFSAKMVWCRKIKWQEKISVYIFRIIVYLFDLKEYLMWFNTWL